MRARWTTLALLPLVALAALPAGCGGGAQKGEHAPIACTEGKETILDALRGAPGEVLLAGETPLSSCLVAGAEEGELADLGEAALFAATQLNSEGRSEPLGPAPVELGYLLGALTRGSADTEGVHAELVRRLTVAATFAPSGETLSGQFRSQYRKGFRAGRSHG